MNKFIAKRERVFIFHLSTSKYVVPSINNIQCLQFALTQMLNNIFFFFFFSMKRGMILEFDFQVGGITINFRTKCQRRNLRPGDYLLQRYCWVYKFVGRERPTRNCHISQRFIHMFWFDNRELWRVQGWYLNTNFESLLC